jgi:hypothetical protein
MPPVLEKELNQLNSFLRSELSAVETYEHALERLSDDPEVAQTLRECRDSHQQRVHALRRAIQQLGGLPSDVCGIWGAFARLLEGSPGDLGTANALAALQRGEDYCRIDYENWGADLSPWMRTFIDAQLVPEQRRSLGSVTSLSLRRLGRSDARSTPVPSA